MVKFFASIVFVFITFSASASAECNRDAFKGWKSKDYTNTRAKVLQRDSIGELDWLKKGTGLHIVRRGTFRDAFSGEIVHHISAEKMHVDHVIPVCFAWERGAANWSEEERRSFYNDMSLLIITKAGLNQSKGVKPPWEFMPINRKDACKYSRAFTEGILRYGLALSTDEIARMKQHSIDVCNSPRHLGS